MWVHEFHTAVSVQFHAGNNVGTGKDFTLYSLQEGIVVFETIKRRSCVSCPPASLRLVGLY